MVSAGQVAVNVDRSNKRILVDYVYSFMITPTATMKHKQCLAINPDLPTPRLLSLPTFLSVQTISYYSTTTPSQFSPSVQGDSTVDLLLPSGFKKTRA